MKRLTSVLLLLILAAPTVVLAETEAERRARLEKELREIESQITEQQQLVEQTQAERQSLERDLRLIDAQIDKAQLGIQARAVAIEQLIDQIDEKEEVVEILDERSLRQRQSLGELVRKTQEVDDYSLIELMLSNQNFSEFFTDLEDFRSINESLKDSLSALKEIKRDTLDQKQSLEDKQTTELELKQLQEREKATIEAREAEKEQILEVTRGEEDAYRSFLEVQKKTAAQLRAQLFALLGGGGPIPFPDAVVLAENAAAVSGVPAALILAILEQESEYGSNLGSCTMGDTSSGKDIMHPTRDKPVFLAIADALGFDATTQRVSCPIRRSDGTRLGWGGAMGPSQFIPSTWAIYGGFVNSGGTWTYSSGQDSIRSLLGKSTPSSPYNNQDAFLATALLLRDNGANGTYSSDRLAALRYYAGWGGASNPENQFYGDNVMARKQRLEGEIKILSGG
ncbi:MAG: lytic murein transglycosylase [Candidatus Paceibacterota bacterium]